MNFQHADYLPFIIAAITILSLVTLYLERSFFKVVKLYWFFNRSLFSYLSSFFFILGMSALLLSLLDFRGPEEKVKGGVPTERTIILIDTSASMLAEDVKPSRLQKAALIAKHFARKAVGHQLSIVAFAEIQKKIVPFTQDLDLIDARLDSIKNLRNQNGASALTQAIQESVQYFKETGESRGNILVLTDGEETADQINLQIPKDVHLALVGIGTEQGGRIPLDDGRGLRYGYKKVVGKDVITKLHEGFFKRVVADLPSAQYWLANSYTLPSDEILEFFKGEKINSEKQQDMVIKPVMMEWAVVPALGFLVLSYFFKAIRVFSLGLLIMILPLQAQESKEPELSAEVVQKLEQLQKGELDQLEKLKLADDLQKAGATSEAIALYEENLPVKKIDPSLPPEAYVNYGTALLEKGDAQKGLSLYDNLSRALENDAKGNSVRELMEKNVVNFFRVQEQKKQEKKDQQKKEGEEQGEDKQQNPGQSGQQSNNPQQGNQKQQKKDGQGEQEKKDQEKKDQEKNQVDQQGQDEKEKSEKDQPKDSKGANEQKIPPQKMPAKLKQLMSDDRQLQLKIIEQNTRDMNRRQSRKNKDW